MFSQFRSSTQTSYRIKELFIEAYNSKGISSAVTGDGGKEGGRNREMKKRRNKWYEIMSKDVKDDGNIYVESWTVRMRDESKD